MLTAGSKSTSAVKNRGFVAAAKRLPEPTNEDTKLLYTQKLYADYSYLSRFYTDYTRGDMYIINPNTGHYEDFEPTYEPIPSIPIFRLEDLEKDYIYHPVSGDFLKLSGSRDEVKGKLWKASS